jgi:hypothetical protein
MNHFVTTNSVTSFAICPRRAFFVLHDEHEDTIGERVVDEVRQFLLESRTETRGSVGAFVLNRIRTGGGS